MERPSEDGESPGAAVWRKTEQLVLDMPGLGCLLDIQAAMQVGSF